MEDPFEFDGPSVAPVRHIRPVPLPVATVESESPGLEDELAAALRAVRGYVPHHIWWEAGPAQALLAYQALHGAQAETP